MPTKSKLDTFQFVFKALVRSRKKKKMYIAVNMVKKKLFAHYTHKTKTEILKWKFRRRRTRGGGGALTSQLGIGAGVPLGFKTWPCLKPLGAQKMHPASQYTLLKTFIRIPCCNIAHLGYTLSYCCITVYKKKPRSRACHKHCGLGSNPVINGVARQ